MDSNDNLDAMLKKLKPQELAILRWRLQRREEQKAPAPLPLIWFMLGGRGCVAEGTPIWDPSLQTYRPIEDMKKPGWVLTTSGPVLASPSYIKGKAALYRVETETGDVVLVTAEHQFLTQRGYLPLKEIGNDDVILSLDPRGLPAGAQHLMETPGDSQADCHPQSHSDGQRPHQAPAADQGRTLRRDGVLGHNRWQSQKDGSTPSPKCNHHRPESDHHSRSSSFLDVQQPEVDQFPPELLSDESFHQRLQETARFLRRTYQQTDPKEFLDLSDGHQKSAPGVSLFFPDASQYQPLLDAGSWSLPVSQNGQRVRGQSSHRGTVGLLLQEEAFVSEPSEFILSDAGCGLTAVSARLGLYLNHMAWARVRTVEFVGIQNFYDIHVPGVNNYLAAGMFHHNSGKTKTGSNHLFEIACNLPWTSKYRTVRVALVGNTYDDVKKTMVEGDSGLLGVIPPEQILKWNRTIGELVVKVNGPDGEYREIVFGSYTAMVPEKLRGPQFHLAWIDEPAKFQDADADPMGRDTTWSNLILGLRLGDAPHLVVTGTPTPCKLVVYLLEHKDTITTHMTTWANRDNLPRNYKEELERLDPSSRTYRQEVLAEVLLDNPAALFTEENINADRAEPPTDEVVYKVLGYDPSASSSDDSDEAGIVVVGYTPEVKSRAKQNATGGGRPLIEKHTEAYVLQDLSGHFTPSEQSALVIKTVLEQRIGDLIFEQNQGADMVVTLLSQALRDQSADFTIRRRKKPKQSDFGPIKRFDVTVTLFDGGTHKFLMSAIQATKSKKIRAETASYQYDFHRVHHPTAGLPVCKKDNCRTALEYEMTTWNPENTSGRYMSPNRLDALVYAIHHIFGRHAMHANANSKLSLPAPNRAAPRADQMIQATNRKKVNPLVSIYSVDLMSGRAPDGFDDPFNRRIA